MSGTNRSLAQTGWQYLSSPGRGHPTTSMDYDNISGNRQCAGMQGGSTAPLRETGPTVISTAPAGPSPREHGRQAARSVRDRPGGWVR